MTITPQFDESKIRRDASGQFATKPAGEADVELTGDATPQPASEAMSLLRAGLTKTHGEEWVQDTVENMDGYEGSDANHELLTVGSALSEALADVEGRPGMGVGLESDSDGAVGGYNVTARFYDSEGNYVTLSSFYDLKYCTTDRQAEGEDAAKAYAENLLGDYEHLERLGNRLGLNPDRPAVPGMDDDGGAQALAVARRQMDAGRIAYETQLAAQITREVRAAFPTSAGVELQTYDEDGTYYVSRVVDVDGETLWDEDDEDDDRDTVSRKTSELLAAEAVSSWTAPEGSPLSGKLRW